MELCLLSSFFQPTYLLRCVSAMSLTTGVSSWTPQFRVSPQEEVVTLQLNQKVLKKDTEAV